MNNQVHSALSGTETQKNLTDAFGGEARSSMRYRIFSHLAKESGDPVLSELLKKISDNEAEHAELWLGYLGELSGDLANLESQLASEEYESDVMYPEFSKTATDEGFSEIAQKLMYAANAEKGHAELLRDYLEKLRKGTLYTSDDNNKEWTCTNCGYNHRGKDAPERCPLCSYPGTYFIRDND